MPTSRDMTPHRVLPFLLAIPLLLLFLSARAGDSGVASGLSPVGGLSSLSHRLPVPIPWEDDVLTTGLPARRPVAKRTVRKPVPVCVIVSGKPVVVRPGFRPGSRIVVSSFVDSLEESLLLSRPPPAVPPPDGDGGGEGNDGIQNQIV